MPAFGPTKFPITVAQGGTSFASYTAGDFLVATGATTFAKQAIGTDGQVLTVDTAQTNKLKWATPAAATPGGANTDVQYNDSGVLAGDANLVWNKTTKRLGIGTTGGNFNPVDALTSDHDAAFHLKTTASISSSQDGAMFYSEASTDGSTFKFALFGLSRSTITSDLTATIYTNAPNGFCVATNSTTLRLQIDNVGNHVPGSGALATNAVAGWTWIETCPGTPIGTPSPGYTGRGPIIYDTSATKLWVYDPIAAAWKGVVLS